MPSAFSKTKSNSDRDDMRRQYAEANAAREAAEIRTKKLADEAEKKRVAEALNFGSERSYPGLGVAVATPRPVLNFRQATVRGSNVVTPKAVTLAVPAASSWSPPKSYGIHEDDEDEADWISSAAAEEQAAEFNADLAPMKRRGDKGIW